MAIAEMKKIRLLGLKTEEHSIMSALHKTKTVELKETKEFEQLSKGLQFGKKDLNEKISRLGFAINLIEDSVKEMKKYGLYEETEKKSLFTVRKAVTFHDFNLITAREYEILSNVEALEGYSEKLTGLKSENSKNVNLIEQLKIYSEIDIPLNKFTETKNTVIMLGTLPSESIKAYNEYFEKQKNVVTKLYNSGSVFAVTIICLKDDYKNLSMHLSSIGFTRANFDYENSAKQIIKECQKNIDKIEKKKIAVLKKILNYTDDLAEIKLLYDYNNLSSKRAEFENNFKSSLNTFILEAFVPTEKVDFVKDCIFDKTKNVMIDVFDVEEEDNPPTYTKNSALVAPFESVTNMYSVPSPQERDPNIFVGIFFFIFFGIMLSDAGYGILLALGAFLLLKNAKMESNMQKMVKVIALGGLSTILWGVIFGGWFGVDLANAENNPVAKFLLSLQWFSPMEEPLMMLGLCLGLGIVQILFGLGLKASALIRQGKPLDAFMDIGSWYLLFAGIGVIAAAMVVKNDMLSDIGMYILIASVLLLILTQGRAEKGIFKKLFKGISSLYGIVGYVSDILSYARLFGLGLATGVVGLVMNTIAGLLLPTWYLSLFGVIILLVGHTFNIGINVLGAYIHNCRLQYIEFFSRFYKGGGHVFMPYGTDLKYYNIK